MKRPQISMMGIQSGENYLINFINEQSKYIDYLERNNKNERKSLGIGV
jgi:hypothetical protein